MVRRYFDLKDAVNNTMDDAMAALMPSRREENHLNNYASTGGDKTLGFADRALEKRKLQCEMPCEYPEIAVIPPTTNICERQSKYVLGNDHQGLLPINLEIILFLKVNLHLWNVKTEADVVNASKWDVCKR
ncbi:hypothetical protein GQ600_15116 [Phytophthora cactorum]|nr:hypothetical protein GQ600_15116 [Phytophthora cactorum]